MILKSLSRKSNNSGQLIEYVLRYALHPEKNKEFLKSKPNIDRTKLTVRHNIRARSLKGIVAEFAKNESFRLVKRKDSVRLYHSVLSLSDRDRPLVNEEIINDLAQKFISLRGLNSLYIGAAHFDKDHAHIHILHSGTSLDGRSARISKQQLHSIKINLDRYQQEKYPSLIHSLPEHGRKRSLAKENIVKAVQKNRQTKKEGLLATLERLYGTATSKTQFLNELKQQGHEVYFRGEKAQGVIVDNVKFRFSRLGFDEERLQALEHTEHQLVELEELRNGLTHQTFCEALLEETAEVAATPAAPEELLMLDELADLRHRRTYRRLEMERKDDFERDHDEQLTLFDKY